MDIPWLYLIMVTIPAITGFMMIIEFVMATIYHTRCMLRHEPSKGYNDSHRYIRAWAVEPCMWICLATLTVLLPYLPPSLPTIQAITVISITCIAGYFVLLSQDGGRTDTPMIHTLHHTLYTTILAPAYIIITICTAILLYLLYH